MKSNIRGHKIIVEREYAYYLIMLFWFSIGAFFGVAGHKGYLMYMSFLYDEPIEYLCKNNTVFEQIELHSTVYVKTDRDCVDWRDA